MELDKETQAIVKNQKQINAFVKTEEWQSVRKIFIEEMAKLLDIGQLAEFNSPTDLAIDVHGRKLASQTLFEILRNVEGEAQAYETTKDFSPSVHPYIITSGD